MDEAAIARYITETFAGVEAVVADGNSFFFYNPDRALPPDHKFPFVTIVTNDAYDQASALSRPSVFRLNLGLSRETYGSLFGRGIAVEQEHDFTALDRLMPHPVYGSMNWICVLNPSAATFETVRPLLAEAYGRAAKK
jgi:hypothetical protein